MPVSLADAQTALSAWVAADLAVAGGQSYAIGSRILTRVDADEIRKSINYWSDLEAKLTRANAGESKTSFQRAKFV